MYQQCYDYVRIKKIWIWIWTCNALEVGVKTILFYKFFNVLGKHRMCPHKLLKVHIQYFPLACSKICVSTSMIVYPKKLLPLPTHHTHNNWCSQIALHTLLQGQLILISIPYSYELVVNTWFEILDHAVHGLLFAFSSTNVLRNWTIWRGYLL